MSVREETSGVLSSIDEILGDVSGLSAKIAFNNLFPLHEGDDELGERFQNTGSLFNPDYSEITENGRQRGNYCSPPPPHGMDEDPDYCTVCYLRISNPWARVLEWIPGQGRVRVDEESHYGYIRNPAAEQLDIDQMDRPFMLTSYNMYEIQMLLTTTNKNVSEVITEQLSPWNEEAFLYSLEFFGEEHFRFEANYGNEAMTIQQIAGACL